MNYGYNKLFLTKTVIILTSLFFTLYFVNIRPALASFYIIKGTNENQKIKSGFYSQTKSLKYFQEGFSYDSFGRAENGIIVGKYALTLFNNRDKIFSEDIKAVLGLAIDEIKKTLEYNPKDARYRAMLGMLYLKLAEYDVRVASLSEKAFEETLAVNSNRPDILFLLSKVELILNNNKKAITVLKQAIALAPTSADFNAALPIYYFIDGDIENAREAVIGRFQGILDIERLLGFYEKYSLYAEMIPFYEDAMVLEPTNAKWPVGLMEVYLKLDNRENAMEMAKKAVSLMPSLRESLSPLL